MASWAVFVTNGACAVSSGSEIKVSSGMGGGGDITGSFPLDIAVLKALDKVTASRYRSSRSFDKALSKTRSTASVTLGFMVLGKGNGV